MSELDAVRKHLRQNHKFEGGVTRDKSRRRATHEFFTPDDLVDLGLSLFDDGAWLPGKTFIDNSVGDGQLLSGVVIKKVASGCTYQQALDDIYGVEYEIDNCLIAICRLYGAYAIPKICILTGEFIPSNWRSSGLKAVFEVNGKICHIVCADGLKYDYSFGEAPPASTVASESAPKPTGRRAKVQPQLADAGLFTGL